MRKSNNYLLKSDFKINSLKKLSSPKYLNTTVFNNTMNSFNFQQSHSSPKQSPLPNKIYLKDREALNKKFKVFFDKCDNEEYEERHVTNSLKEKIGYFKKEIRNLRKKTDDKKMQIDFNKESREGNFKQFKNQTKFKKKIIDILLNPIENKHDLFFIYSKNQAIKDHIKRNIIKK